MQPMTGPHGFGRPATEAERAAFRADLAESPYARAARHAAYRQRVLSRRRDRERCRREARRGQDV